MKQVFLHARPFLPNVKKLKEVVDICRKKGLSLFGSEEAILHLGTDIPPADFTKAYDLGITFGGDGTVLGALRLLQSFSTPLLPISAGSLGFLAEIPPESFEQTLEMVLEKKCSLDERAMLSVRVPKKNISLFALNEAILGASGEFRMAKIRSLVDGEPLTLYRADGVLIATPTGSTAYSLSAGGPLIYPSLEAMILLPVSPHSFTQKPLVLPPWKKITLLPDAKNFFPLLLAIDGKKICTIEKGERVEITIAKEKARFLRLPEEHYFKTLRRKLFWGGGNKNSPPALIKNSEKNALS